MTTTPQPEQKKKPSVLDRRVAHPFRLYRKGWVAVQCAAALLTLGITGEVANAQSAPCGLTTIHTSPDFKYPPLPRAAHVQGSVILLVTFAHDGTATAVKVLQGPTMLKDSAAVLGKELVANPFGGSRECAIVANFAIDRPSEATDDCHVLKSTLPSIIWQDAQHVTIHASSYMTCDPSVTIATTAHRWQFLFFHGRWKPVTQ